MQKVVTREADSPPRSLVRPGSSFALLAIFFAALWFVFFRYLSSEWSLNEQYNYGWFVPFFALYLLWLRWEDRPASGAQLPAAGGIRGDRTAATVPPGLIIAIAVFALLLLLPVRLFEIGNPDWRTLGWLHAAVVLPVTLIVLWLAGGTAWLKHFAFPIAFCLVAVPWMSVIEIPLIQGLMHAVAAVAAETLNLCGVPAQLEGSLIRVNTGLVGVNEACSGVRSLQTSLMIGLLFGELKRLGVASRFFLVGGALGVALFANCLRAVFLVWIAASQGISSVEKWHDAAGYSIVAAVFVSTLALSALLGRGERHPSELASQKISRPPTAMPFGLPRWCFVAALCWIVFVEVGAEGWYRAHEQGLVPVNSWTVTWPEKAPGFREVKLDENVRRTLRFDSGSEAAWKLPPPSGLSADDKGAGCLAYFFRWNPGGTSVVRARAHRPDICLPQAGWDQIADLGTADYKIDGGRAVAFRHVSFRQRRSGVIADTFFCLQEDERRPREERADLQLPVGVQPDWGIGARARVVAAGVRNLGQQVLEVVVVRAVAAEAATAERMFAEMLPTLVKGERSRRITDN